MTVFGVPIEAAQICIIKGGTTKHQALEQLIDAVATHPAVRDKEAFRQAVFDREQVTSTGIGEGIAIPHVRIPQIASPTLGIGIAPKGLEYGTLDNQPVYILVLFATPESAQKEYLQLLAKVMTALKNPAFRDRLMNCRKPCEVLEAVKG